MQVSPAKGLEKRAQYYVAKAYCNQMGEGEEYHNLKEVIFLAIADYIMFPERIASSRIELFKISMSLN